jgi:hypothetical protein
MSRHSLGGRMKKKNEKKKNKIRANKRTTIEKNLPRGGIIIRVGTVAIM